MRITFVLTDGGGRMFEGAADLVEVVGRGKRSSVRVKTKAPTVQSLSFDLNLRAFMKKYARRMEGDQKFTLLLARLVKGDPSKEMTVNEIESHWNKMTAVLGGKFNGAYSNRAKEHGWVDSPKRGAYVLSPSWREALAEQNESKES